MNSQHDNMKQEQTEPNLEEALEALQAVVMVQKAQVDALLASLEGLLAALDAPLSPPRQQTFADSSLLGNPQDPQFASLHQLIGRLKAA